MGTNMHREARAGVREARSCLTDACVALDLAMQAALLPPVGAAGASEIQRVPGPSGLRERLCAARKHLERAVREARGVEHERALVMVREAIRLVERNMDIVLLALLAEHEWFSVEDPPPPPRAVNTLGTRGRA